MKSIDEGFCFVRLIYDDQREAVDWLYLETNPTFTRQSGLDAVGRKLSDEIPALEPVWFRFLCRVARTRKPGRMEGEVEAIGRWFSVSAAPVSDSEDIVAVVFFDITQQKIAEKALREMEQQLGKKNAR
jgi:PAS domain-containing protein